MSPTYATSVAASTVWTENRERASWRRDVKMEFSWDSQKSAKDIACGCQTDTIVISRDVRFSAHPLIGTDEYKDFAPDNPDWDPEERGTDNREFVEMELDSSTDERPDDEEASTDDNTSTAPPTVVRASGRPRLLRTGQPGRPRKLFHHAPEMTRYIEETDLPEQALLSEVPMRLALTGPDSEEWRDAMTQEIRSIIRNDTWELVDRPRDTKVIGSRIVLRNKIGSDGGLDRRKARLVAQGFLQQPGIHFTKTFAPVSRLSTIRLIAALAARHSMSIRHYDVATAFLNGELQEEIYIESPKQLREILELIVNSERDDEVEAKARTMLLEMNSGDKVCLWKKSLYGLRQAGRQWHATLTHSYTSELLHPLETRASIIKGKGKISC